VKFVPPARGADGGGHPSWGHDFLRYLVKNMMFPSVATVPLLQAYWNQEKAMSRCTASGCASR
jgi:hypothetical protein